MILPSMKSQGKRACRRAAAAAELAMVLPFVLLLLFVAVDYCRIFHASQIVQSSANIGVLYANGLAGDVPEKSMKDAAIEAAVREGATLQPPLKKEQVQVKFEAETVTVTVNYEFKTVMQYFGFPQNIKIIKFMTVARSPATEG